MSAAGARVLPRGTGLGAGFNDQAICALSENARNFKFQGHGFDER